MILTYTHIISRFPTWPLEASVGEQAVAEYEACAQLFSEAGWLTIFEQCMRDTPFQREHDDQKNRSLDVGYPISLEQSSSAMPLQAISLRANHAQYYQAIPRHDCGGSLGEVFLWHNSSTSGILACHAGCFEVIYIQDGVAKNRLVRGNCRNQWSSWIWRSSSYEFPQVTSRLSWSTSARLEVDVSSPCNSASLSFVQDFLCGWWSNTDLRISMRVMQRPQFDHNSRIFDILIRSHQPELWGFSSKIFKKIPLKPPIFITHCRCIHRPLSHPQLVARYARALADFGMCCRLDEHTARHFGHRGLCFRRLGRVEDGGWTGKRKGMAHGCGERCWDQWLELVVYTYIIYYIYICIHYIYIYYKFHIQ